MGINRAKKVFEDGEWLIKHTWRQDSRHSIWEYCYHYRGMLHRRSGPSVKRIDGWPATKRTLGKGYYLYGIPIKWE